MLATEQGNQMAMSIDAGIGPKVQHESRGIVVPSAAVWMAEDRVVKPSRSIHVRTLDSSNRSRFDPPRGLHLHDHATSISKKQRVREATFPVLQRPAPTTPPRSMVENAKQWAGGGLFGLVIFVGILISQPGEEVVAPDMSYSQLEEVHAD